MKKLLMFFTVAAVAITTGCNKGLSDYETTCLWEIENWTDSEVTFIFDPSGTTVPHDAYEVVIPLRETKEIGRSHGSSADNIKDLPDLFYHPDQPMVGSTHTLKVGDEILPETVWIRRLWYFNAEPLKATYKLILTKELIGLLKQPLN